MHAGAAELLWATTETIAAGNPVAARSTITDRQCGEVAGAPSSGVPVQFDVMTATRIEDGDVVEDRALWDAIT